jgi:hypothetical protein
LDITAAEGVRAPNISLFDDDQVRRYLLLPTSVDDEQIAWKIAGPLREAAFPDDYSVVAGDPESYDCYEIVGPRFQARIQEVERKLGEPRIMLADVHVIANQTDDVFAIASFVMEPAGLSTCVIQLPEKARLKKATVAGIPAQTVALQHHRFRLHLGDPQLPQQIEVVYCRPTAARHFWSHKQVYYAPVVEEIPVERTLWTIRGNQRTVVGTPNRDIQSSQVRHELYRLKALDRMIDRASRIAAERATSEINNWYYRWTRSLAESRNRVRELRPIAAEAELRQLEESLASVERRQIEFTKRLRTEQVQSDVEAESSLLVGVSDLVTETSAPGAHIQRFTVAGESESISAEYLTDRERFSIARIGAALFAVLLGLALWRICRVYPLGEWLAEWAYVMGVLIGTAWWLWFSPAWIGACVIVLSVFGAVRLPIQSQRVPR